MLYHLVECCASILTKMVRPKTHQQLGTVINVLRVSGKEASKSLDDGGSLRGILQLLHTPGNQWDCLTQVGLKVGMDSVVSLVCTLVRELASFLSG